MTKDFDGVSTGYSVDPSVSNGCGRFSAESLSFDDDLYQDRSSIERDDTLLSVEEIPGVVDVTLGVAELE